MRLGAASGLSIVELLRIMKAERFNFYDEFNRPGVDTDVWDVTLDGTGTWAKGGAEVNGPLYWRLKTGNVIDNDSALNVVGTTLSNRVFAPEQPPYTTVAWETRIRFSSIADISAFIGLSAVGRTGYSEGSSAIHFLADPAITNTFRARSFDAAAEEETDTLIALDTAWHTLKIVWIVGQCLYYIDDVLVVTHVTHPGVIAMGSTMVIRTEAAATKDLDIDYIRVEMS